ncbi:hypothetical protein F5Y14DRAFT_433841, partial [Nemania sp. NC0429]
MPESFFFSFFLSTTAGNPISRYFHISSQNSLLCTKPHEQLSPPEHPLPVDFDDVEGMVVAVAVAAYLVRTCALC